MAIARLSLRVGAGSTIRRVRRDGEEGQPAIGTQTLIRAFAGNAGTRGPPGGEPSPALGVRSRWRLRATSTPRRARPARMASRFAVAAGAGRLAGAPPPP